jgi:hypothetical protein
MTFAFIPKANYTIGQVIQVHGQSMVIDSFTHSGRNLIVRALNGLPRFIVCICTDAKDIAP